MDISTIAARFKQANVPLDGKDTWKVQSATVIKHSALERLAAGCEIVFDAPTILRAEADEAVMVVIGRMGDKMEWSTGEAKIDLNYRVSGKQAGYPYAMAEKRGKDRVIIKLVGLHGVYSSEEADDFKPNAKQDDPEPPRAAAAQDTEAEGDGTLAEKLIKDLRKASTVEDLERWTTVNKTTLERLPGSYAEDVRDAYRKHRGKLSPPAREAAE